jgi:sulfoacetaldehyde acetyltransferase
MKMTTEEAFVKVLQMHGIEHAFGIIGSAFMPISDLFPKAGITFWDVAHECNGGYMADGYTRATGKIAMYRAEWPRYHQLRHRYQDRILEPHADAADHTAGGQ